MDTIKCLVLLGILWAPQLCDALFLSLPGFWVGRKPEGKVSISQACGFIKPLAEKFGFTFSLQHVPFARVHSFLHMLLTLEWLACWPPRLCGGNGLPNYARPHTWCMGKTLTIGENQLFCFSFPGLDPPEKIYNFSDRVETATKPTQNAKNT